MIDPVQLNRLLLTTGVPAGLPGVQALVDRNRELDAENQRLTARITEMETTPAGRADELTRQFRELADILDLPGGHPVQELLNRARGLAGEMRRLDAENRTLRRKLVEWRTLGRAEQGVCHCEYRVPLVDRLGHDRLGHRLGALLSRERVETEAQLMALTDEQLSRMRELGPTLMTRLHERLAHCANSPLWVEPGSREVFTAEGAQSPAEIIGQLTGSDAGVPGPWRELYARFAPRLGGRNTRLMVQAARFLEDLVPGERWSPAEFARLLDRHVAGRWPSERDLAVERATQAYEAGAVSREQFARLEERDGWVGWLRGRGTRVLEAWDEQGGVVAFDGIVTPEDLRIRDERTA